MGHLHALLQNVEPFLHHYGLWAVFLFLFLETFGLPLPGETLLIGASALASQGQFHLPTVLLVAWAAAVLGDNCAFYLGRYGGRRLLVRLGGRIGLTDKRLDKVQHFFERFGGEVVILARFFEGARQLNGLVAGTSGMAPIRFLVYNLIGAALWVGFWAMAAFYLGHHLDVLYAWMGRLFLAFGLVGLVAGGAYLVHRRRRQRGH